MTQPSPNLSPAFTGAAEAKQPKRRSPPFSLRLSDEERARLERDAAGESLGSYVRARLFGAGYSPRKRGKFPVKDHTLLATLLGKLGASRLPNNLNQLAKLAHLGALPVSPEVEDELRQACAEIAIMKVTLLRALQIKED